MLQSNVDQIWCFVTRFHTVPNAKFRENPSCGYRVDAFEQMDRQAGWRTDMTKLMLALSLFMRTILKMFVFLKGKPYL